MKSVSVGGLTKWLFQIYSKRYRLENAEEFLMQRIIAIDDQFLVFKKIRGTDLVCNPKVMDWCGLPYPRHPKGCPNFQKPERKRCPYNTVYIEKYLDKKKPLYLVRSDFNLSAYVKIMRDKHPTWTERQLRNVLYWQQGPKGVLKRRAMELAHKVGANLVVTAGEAVGINLYATCARAGWRLEKICELKNCCFIAVVGWRKKKYEEIHK